MTEGQNGAIADNRGTGDQPSLLEQITAVLYAEDPDTHPHSMVNYMKASQQARAVLDALAIEETTDDMYNIATEFDGDGKPVALAFSGTLEACREWLPRIEKRQPGAKIVARTRTVRYLPTLWGPYKAID